MLYTQHFLIYSLVIALLHILTTECGNHQAVLKMECLTLYIHIFTRYYLLRIA